MALEDVTEASSRTLRRAYPCVLARTFAFTRNLPEAEDAVQDAVIQALATWPTRGIPDSPEAWLFTVASRKHRDRLRKSKWEEPRQDVLESLAQRSPWVCIAAGHPEQGSGWSDELLRLVFACCHPALEPGESAALCLSTVLGLSILELSAAFVTEARSMEQRLTRARRRLRERGDPEGAPPHRSHDRLDAVTRVLHLLYNEGYWSTDDAAPIRSDLCHVALRLAGSLAETYSDDPEVLALLALLILHESRREARLGDHGRPVPLPEQDRSRWDTDAIARAIAILSTAHALGGRGPLQIEAAIAAMHSRAPTAESTDWPEIANLYESLEALRPTPAVRVNRAFALARAHGAQQGLNLLDDRRIIDATEYPYVHLVRGTLLAELGRTEEARASLLLALGEARNAAESTQIEEQLARLAETTSTAISNVDESRC